MSPGEKRPRDPQRAERIVAAARALVREGGMNEITHRAVAERAGVPLGSTTYYFKTIDDMIAQAIRLDIAEFRQRMTAVLADTVRLRPVARIVTLMQQEESKSVDFAGGYDLYLTAIVRPVLRPLAIEWGDALIDVLSAFLTREQAVAVAVFLDGHGIRTALLGRADLPSAAVFEHQLLGLIGAQE